LKAKSTWQRAEALLNIAHPDFRERLIKEAEHGTATDADRVTSLHFRHHPQLDWPFL
jgi:acyl-CoA hydrolase